MFRYYFCIFFYKNYLQQYDSGCEEDERDQSDNPTKSCMWRQTIEIVLIFLKNSSIPAELFQNKTHHFQTVKESRSYTWPVPESVVHITWENR